MLDWLASSQLAGLLLGALFKALTDWLADKRGEQALKDLGAAQSAAAANKEAADAEARMAQVDAQPITRDAAADRLQSGSG